jgi:hypothetical protein
VSGGKVTICSVAICCIAEIILNLTDMVALSPSDRLGAAMIVRKREPDPSPADLSRSLVNAMVAKILRFLRNPECASEAIGNL